MDVVKCFQRINALKLDAMSSPRKDTKIRYVNLVGRKRTMDKIDTQGMSLPGRSKKPSSYEPMPVKIRTIFTPEERIELKQIIHEALDEREKA